MTKSNCLFRWTRKAAAGAFAAAFIVLSISAPVSAAPVWWNSGPGNNNHWYEVISAPGGITWDDAQADAISRGGYLATILSAEENDFAFALVDSPSFWVLEGAGPANLGPWLGGYQPDGSPEAGGGWTWVNGDGPFAYTNWHGGEPNNGWAEGESRLHYFEYGGRSKAWNDLRDNIRGVPYAGPIAYVLEYDSLPVPEPATLILLAGGLMLTRLTTRRNGRS